VIQIITSLQYTASLPTLGAWVREGLTGIKEVHNSCCLIALLLP